MNPYHATLSALLKDILPSEYPGLDDHGACTIPLADGTVVVLELSDILDIYSLSTVLSTFPDGTPPPAALLRRSLEINVESGLLLGVFTAITREPAALLCLTRCLLHPQYTLEDLSTHIQNFATAAAAARGVLLPLAAAEASLNA